MISAILLKLLRKDKDLAEQKAEALSIEDAVCSNCIMSVYQTLGERVSARCYWQQEKSVVKEIDDFCSNGLWVFFDGDEFRVGHIEDLVDYFANYGDNSK